MRAASAIGQTTAEGVSSASSIAVGVGATALKVVGASFFVVGAIAGVSVGGYVSSDSSYGGPSKGGEGYGAGLTLGFRF